MLLMNNGTWLANRFLKQITQLFLHIFNFASGFKKGQNAGPREGKEGQKGQRR
jgi:hypothetical protein